MVAAKLLVVFLILLVRLMGLNTAIFLVVQPANIIFLTEAAKQHVHCPLKMSQMLMEPSFAILPALLVTIIVMAVVNQLALHHLNQSL